MFDINMVPYAGAGPSGRPVVRSQYLPLTQKEHSGAPIDLSPINNVLCFENPYRCLIQIEATSGISIPLERKGRYLVTTPMGF
jgi:hypothetical protein